MCMYGGGEPLIATESTCDGEMGMWEMGEDGERDEEARRGGRRGEGGARACIDGGERAHGGEAAP